MWDDGAGRWRVHTDRGDELSCRYYVLAVGNPQPHEAAGHPGHGRLRRSRRSTRRGGTTTTPGVARAKPLTELGDKVVALIGTGATGIQCLPPLAEAAKHVYVFQRTPSAIGVRGNRPTDPSFADGLQPGWQKARMDNFQAIMLGRPVDADLTDDGWTHHYAAVQNPPRRKGMTHRGVHAQRRGARLRDHGGAPPAGRRAGHRSRRRGRDPQAVLPVPLQAAVLPRRVLRRVQPPQRHPRRLPRRHRADHRAGPGRRRTAVRGRLHRLRHRLRGRAHAAAAPRRPRHRRPGRHHARREVGRRRRQPLRDDEPRLPEHVRHAGARASRRSSPSTTPSSPCSGPSSSPAPCELLEQAGSRGVRRERRGRGGLDRADRRHLRRRQRA